MFERIAEELDRAAKGIGMEKLPAMAPAYLFSVKKENRECVAMALEQLLERLEEQNLFLRQTAGLICLSVEYGISERGIGETLGLADEFGRMKASLEQWLFDMNVQYQVAQGIILIRIDQFKELLSEEVWQRRFFRQMNKYRKDFLFLFQTEPRDVAAAQEWIGRECFCRSIAVRQWETADYAEFFKRRLREADLFLDRQGERILTELLERHVDEMNSQVLGRWQQKLVWGYFVSGELKKKERVFPASYLTEDSLKMCLEKSRIMPGIGFEVKEYEEK